MYLVIFLIIVSFLLEFMRYFNGRVINKDVSVQDLLSLDFMNYVAMAATSPYAYYLDSWYFESIQLPIALKKHYKRIHAPDSAAIDAV